MIDWLRREMLEPEIKLGERTVPIALHRHPRARRLTLRLAPDGSEVRITMPGWARSAEAIAFAHARREWLAAQMEKIPIRRSPEPGHAIKIRGVPLVIDWRANAARTPSIVNGKVSVGGPIDAIERRLARWLQKQALVLLSEDTAHYCEVAQLDSVPVSLSRAQKRWGSCSDKKRLRINWRLIQAPDEVRRSVVAHEVAHLVHFDHSPQFYGLLGEIFEGDLASADKWLKENGRSLYTQFG
ncbi:MAG TPA: metal-dependent hydrolase [Erythrobacter sp.]|nr:metal-dependent hydrolase [Erythrobacter sp.]